MLGNTSTSVGLGSSSRRRRARHPTLIPAHKHTQKGTRRHKAWACASRRELVSMANTEAGWYGGCQARARTGRGADQRHPPASAGGRGGDHGERAAGSGRDHRTGESRGGGDRREREYRGGPRLFAGVGRPYSSSGSTVQIASKSTMPAASTSASVSTMRNERPLTATNTSPGFQPRWPVRNAGGSAASPFRSMSRKR